MSLRFEDTDGIAVRIRVGIWRQRVTLKMFDAVMQMIGHFEKLEENI